MAKKTKNGKNEKGGRDELLRRSMFYAISLFVVFQLMLLPLEARIYPVYWGAAALGFIVVAAELIYARAAEKREPIEIDMKHLRDRKWREHLFHHAFLPAVLYASGVLYLFFNRIRALDQVAVVLLSGTFLVIFYNMAAAYRRMYSVTRDTRMLFDFINIITFYFFVDVLINLAVYEGWPRYVVFVGSGMITFSLIALMIILVKQMTRQTLGLLILSSILMGAVVLAVWSIPIFNIAVLSLVATIGFYLVDVYWHHRLEGTLNNDVMTQYGLFALMALILLLYL
jgi:hypothetical protein